uniref:Ycf37 n=1 Tax=Phyllymenia taiwanensis TaxID=1260292 RepID=R9XWU4_9FLOR|nr:Ycf37 [Grateloupia taiwanensis]AGO19947.1 Ycf37 [Grateloupia taiwanensis]
MVFMFQLYLVFIILFLIPLCYLVTNEIVKLLFENRLSKSLIPLGRSQKLTKEQVLSLAKIYIRKKQWLSCILMLEFYAKIDNSNLGEYYNSIGFCYQLIDFNLLAKDYYSQARAFSPSNILFLKNLAKVYWLCNNLQDSLSTYKQILELDPQNKIALDNINILIKKIKKTF